MNNKIGGLEMWENRSFLLERTALCSQTIDEWIRKHGSYKACLLVLESLHTWPEPTRTLMRTALGR